MMVEGKGTRTAILALSKQVIHKVTPTALTKYSLADIAHYALDGEIHFGPEDDALEMASSIVQAIRDTIRTRSEDIIRASTLDTVFSMVISDIKEQATRLRGTGDAQAIAEGLSMAIEEHPSHLDNIASAVTPVFQTVENEADKNLRQSVVRVINMSEGFMGSGFAIGKTRHVLTAHHVVTNAKQLEVVFDGTTNGSNWRGSARVVASLPGQDLSILKIQNSPDAERAGLMPCRLGFPAGEAVKGHPVLGLGYHADVFAEEKGILDPCPTLARVVQHLPVRKVAFGDGFEQPCLILVVAAGQETIHKGMSGGPLLDLETNEVIALITGAQPARVKQFTGQYEGLPAVEYGFGVLFSDVTESWPEFKQYCPTGA